MIGTGILGRLLRAILLDPFRPVPGEPAAGVTIDSDLPIAR